MSIEYENNVLYLDYIEMKHKLTLHNNKSPRIRLYLGQMREDNKFDVTIETIKNLPDDIETKVREYIKSLF